MVSLEQLNIKLVRESIFNSSLTCIYRSVVSSIPSIFPRQKYFAVGVLWLVGSVVGEG